jgi:hypothetical protein
MLECPLEPMYLEADDLVFIFCEEEIPASADVLGDAATRAADMEVRDVVLGVVGEAEARERLKVEAR